MLAWINSILSFVIISWVLRAIVCDRVVCALYKGAW